MDYHRILITNFLLDRREEEETEKGGTTRRGSSGRGSGEVSKRCAHTTHEAVRGDGTKTTAAGHAGHGGAETKARKRDRGGGTANGRAGVPEELRGVAPEPRQQLAKLPGGRQEEKEGEEGVRLQHPEVETGESVNEGTREGVIN